MIEMDLSTSEFKKLYTLYFWNKNEYLRRYFTHNITLHHYLKSHNIPHMFFDAFYEPENPISGNGVNAILDNQSLVDEIRKFKGLPAEKNVFHQYSKIYDDNFIKTIFNKFIIEKKSIYTNEVLFERHHPSELSHKLWANYIYSILNEKI
jgi:hypothetical protein